MMMGGIPLRPQSSEPVTLDTTPKRSACICDENFKCVRDGAFYNSLDVCIPYDSENTRLERVNVTSLNATHVPTQTRFQAIIGRAISPWVTVSIGGDGKLVIIHFDQVLDVWLRHYKNNRLLIEGKISVVTAEQLEISNTFDLEAKIAIDSDAPYESEMFGCLCDDSNTCIDTTTDNANPVLRICMGLLKSSVGRISNITSLILRKDGPRGFPFEVITHLGISPLATVELSGERAIVAVQLMPVFFEDSAPIKISGQVEILSSELATKNLEIIESFDVMANIGTAHAPIATTTTTTSSSESPIIEPGPGLSVIGCICHPNLFDENGCLVGATFTAEEPSVQVCLKAQPKGVELVCTLFCFGPFLFMSSHSFNQGGNYISFHGPR